jgi:NRAMP (natural resistance-associated macrophage protein)-like metal ion transporter
MATSPTQVLQKKKPVAKRLLQKLGPGLITGASDDDPSGIATYSQVGAQFGYGMLWTMLFSYPLMAAIQEISARIGRVTGAGIAGNMRRHYPRALLLSMVSLLVVANTFNLGADIGAMGVALTLLIPGRTESYVVILGAASLLLQVLVPYTKYVHYLKWSTLALFSYVAVVFVVHVPWGEAIRATLLPSFSRQAGYFTALIAVLGTTIVIAFFIMLTTAVTLHAHGQSDIETATQAAQALEPLAGRFTFLLFTAGIIGTGLLAVPVLAGSAAYAVGEALNWHASLERKPQEAKRFYGAIAAATLIGLSLAPALQPHQSFVLGGRAQWSGVRALDGGDDADDCESESDG